MDSICEQLVKIKKAAKDYALLALIWVAAFVLVYVLVLLSFKYAALMGLIIIAVFGIFYGAVMLCKRLSIEYEYIVVNHDMDIDKIIGKSSRKRIVSVKLNEVEVFGAYDDAAKAKLAGRKFDGKFICCNADDEAYYIVVRHAKKGLILVVTAMNERLKDAALKFIPRIAK